MGAVILWTGPMWFVVELCGYFTVTVTSLEVTVR
jgi:hypothetical protein